MTNIQTAILSEYDFFQFHEELLSAGARILRCTVITGGEEGKRYSLIWRV